jgi:hypothetical protein
MVRITLSYAIAIIGYTCAGIQVAALPAIPMFRVGAASAISSYNGGSGDENSDQRFQA